ncbi:unnamed protein product [Ectocarpus sp. CCAP 1310/34]|nr:unnamed protein product [Ectocarpus sp. CCAP 1310/34]
MANTGGGGLFYNVVAKRRKPNPDGKHRGGGKGESLTRDVADEARRAFALALSDHLTLLKAYDGWRLARGCGSRAEREYLRDHFLSRQTLVMVEDMRRQFRGLLRDIGFIESGGSRGGNRHSRGSHSGHPQQQEHSSNVNGGNIQLIKAVVCAGLYPNVAVAPAALCPSSTSASGGGAGGKKPGGGGSKGGAAEKTAGEVIHWFIGWLFLVGVE